jgi:ribosomal protein S18 acetylase RimI-like enzyme
VAQDDQSGHLLGFAHAGFGPLQPLGPSHRLDTSMGTLAMLLTEPDRDDPELEMGLIVAAERALRCRGAEVFYAGGHAPMDPFYRGLYGGSEFSGVLDSHVTFSRAVARAGYQAVAKTLVLEVDLARPDARDPKAPLLRRQSRLDVVDDARSPGWWDALALGLFRPSQYTLIEKMLNVAIARAWTWEIAGGAGVGDGRSRTALIDLEVAPEFRRKGFGRHLVAEIIRRARNVSSEILTVQTSSENGPARDLYASLGFEQVDSTTLYRLPAELAGRSL